MEAPPDAKRPRLDHEHPAYALSGPPQVLRPASTPSTAAPQHPPIEHPPSVPLAHSYSVPAGLPPSTHLSGHPGASASPYPHENGVDHHRRPSYHSSSNQPGFHDQRPGYGPVAQGHTRSFAPDPVSTHSPSARAPPPLEHLRTVSSGQEKPGGMEHHGHPGPPPGHPYSHMDPHLNGAVSNGMSYHPSDAYAVSETVVHQAYPPTPASGYPPTPGHYQGPAGYGSMQRRKQVRATQACNNCRQRKQKCDEQRPCGYCKNENLDCEYREVPPPKTDRHMQQILEQSRESVERARDTTERVARLEDVLQHVVALLNEQSRAAKASQLLSPAQEPAVEPVPEFVPEEKPVVEQPPPPPEQVQAEEPNENKEEPTDAKEEKVHVEDEPPSSHETGAQYLMKWPRIRDYFRRAHVVIQDYVFEDTEKTGTLRPYGFSLIENGQIIDFADVELNYENHDPQDPAKGFWGDGFLMREYSQGIAVGGNNPDGSLGLDDANVRLLYDSYMRNMWVMHPILDAKWLQTKIERFISEHSPAARYPPREGEFAMPGAPASSGRPDTPGSATGKRKRPSNASEDHMDYGDRPHEPKWQRPRHEPEKSMENAVVLLVLAIGRVLLESGFVLDSLHPPMESSSEGSLANSPYDAARPSPRSFQPYEASSPIDMKSAAMARASSLDPRIRGKKVPNVELFPGLAYFAQAVTILGLNLGGNEIIHAQAFLLAGIYFGQLGRVNESWSWINEACRVTTVLQNRKKFQAKLFQVDSTDLDLHCTLMATLCWSALQLESDLRAELDQLPKPSQLMFMEPKIARPGCPPGVGLNDEVPLYSGDGIKVRDVHISYLFQIELRLTLNRVHAALYSRKTIDVSKNMKRKTTAVWSDSNTSSLFHSLRAIRNVLVHNSNYGWRDGEEPANDMLAARLRAKYYGGEYIILRPYLFNALQWQEAIGGAPKAPTDYIDWLRRYEESAGKAAVDQERFEEFRLPWEEITVHSFQEHSEIAEQFLWCCKRCIDAAMYSTKAFDGVADPLIGQRPRVTNIHGTATAQFSNMLVLAAVSSSWLHWMVDRRTLQHLMHRTIALHEKLSPLTPIFRTNLRILRMAAEELYNPPEKRAQMNHAALWHGSPGSGSQHSMSPGSVGTPRGYAPAATSAHSSFNSARY